MRDCRFDFGLGGMMDSRDRFMSAAKMGPKLDDLEIVALEFMSWRLVNAAHGYVDRDALAEFHGDSHAKLVGMKILEELRREVQDPAN